ncbi:hypothetical protein [Arthrobacter sp. StoSoilB5]|uniref:hypothetical protein n=1 Tax=Arthrobacter sp. StoSoilB5 TaxID=2830992 RepID=UPI001CC7BF15|nr:hypothetical protein [Arthrobacter sp. StoSoilB5]BCW44715.1 hypothetical protein StoSoilB5_18990 [Arthrobacter sp. StoSoilB5]
MVEIEEEHLSELRVRLKEQIENIEVSAARYDAGGAAEGNRLAVTVRVLVHDTSRSSSLLKQMGVKDKLRWIDSNGGRDARSAIMFTSLVVFRARVLEDGMELAVIPVPQSEILERGLLLDFETWWRTAPVMVGNGEQISRADIVDMLANQDGGAHVDLLKARFVKLLKSVPQAAPFIDGEGSGIAFGLPAAPDDGFVRETLRAAMRTIAEEVWLAWNNQLDILDPGWRDRPRGGGRIGPYDLISGRKSR